jgi:hypothetical protein
MRLFSVYAGSWSIRKAIIEGKCLGTRASRGSAGLPVLMVAWVPVHICKDVSFLGTTEIPQIPFFIVSDNSRN